MQKIACFTEADFYLLCDKLASTDKDLDTIIVQYGYPFFWHREASFETLIHIILEQQVSLASAKAALNKLQEKLGNITPNKLLLLTDEELKACYFSRQKIVYARVIANAIVNNELLLDELFLLDDDTIRNKLTKLKGIGNWTVDVFLMMALHRCNLFPTGDIALMKSIKEVKQLPPTVTKEDILKIASKWQPYQTIAAYLLWWAYIKKRKVKI